MLKLTAQRIYYNITIFSRQCFFAPVWKILPSARNRNQTIVEHPILQERKSSVIIKVQRGTQITRDLKEVRIPNLQKVRLHRCRNPTTK